MSKLEIAGKVIAVLEKRSGTSKSGNAWVTQEYVIETAEQYPKKCCFSLFGEEKIAANTGRRKNKKLPRLLPRLFHFCVERTPSFDIRSANLLMLKRW